MSILKAVRRRDFLVQGIGGIALLVSGSVACTPDRHAGPMSNLEMHQAKGLEAVGRAYLATRGGLTTRDMILLELPQSLRKRWVEEGGLASLSASQFRELVRSDFAAQQMQSVDGWWMSSSELRICALVALEKGLA